MAFIILNFHDELILTVCGWLNNPSVSEIFPRNSLLLQRDSRPLWKVEMVKPKSSPAAGRRVGCEGGRSQAFS